VTERVGRRHPGMTAARLGSARTTKRLGRTASGSGATAARHSRQVNAPAATSSGSLTRAAATESWNGCAPASALLFLFLIVRVDRGDESEEDEQTDDSFHKILRLVEVQQTSRGLTRKFWLPARKRRRRALFGKCLFGRVFQLTIGPAKVAMVP